MAGRLVATPLAATCAAPPHPTIDGRAAGGDQPPARAPELWLLLSGGERPPEMTPAEASLRCGAGFEHILQAVALGALRKVQ